MPTKTLSQVVAYISPDLRKQIEEERSKSKQRVSVSAYIESIIKKHFDKKK